MPGNITKVSIKESLSTRLLLFTVFFVIIAEILIYVPSIANFRVTWINQKLAEANIAILVVEAAPDYIVSRLLTDELLSSTETHVIARRIDNENQQILMKTEPIEVAERFDMRNISWWQSVKDAFASLSRMQEASYLIQITGNASGDNNDEIIVVLDESLLCHDMYIYSRNIVLFTIIISLFTAMLVYYSLSNLLVRPVKKITDNMIAFRHAPEDLTKRFNPEERNDEIGVVMRELAVMQDDIRKALNQKNHLAKLGSAISNINHDLRNMLASVQLVTDHLSSIDNPIVQKLVPRFVKSLDRAIRLCENTLQYGGGELETPHPETFNLQNLVDDVSTSLGLMEDSDVRLINKVEGGFELTADNDQFFRVIMNVCRNAIQAIPAKGTITIKSAVEGDDTVIDIIDSGPGISSRVKENLFQPFKSGSQEGTGLGLAISRETVRAHGGTLDLYDTSAKGSTFRIILPR